MFRTTFLLLCTTYLLGTLSSVQAQTTFAHHIELTWKEDLMQIPLTETRTISTINFEGAYYEFDQHVLPYFGNSIKLPTGGKVTVKLRNATYLPVTLPNIPSINDIIGNFIVPTADIAQDKRTFYAIVSFIPIRFNEETATYEKLLSADLEVRVVPDHQGNGQEKGRSYADNSVLSQGEFYKIKTDKTGIYQIDRSFLDDLGIDQNVNINNLRVYGNGGGMLPELAGADKRDDLVENPISVKDNNNNAIFDEGDYALFYAQSPDIWTFNSANARFEHQINYYTNHNYYFINFDIGSGKRVSNMEENLQNVTDSVTTFNDYAFHETEKHNYTSSGRLFLGEEFGFELEQTFSFNFPNLHTPTPIGVRGNFAGRCINCPTSFSASVNDGTPLFTTSNIGGVDGNSEGTYALTTFGQGTANVDNSKIDITLAYNKNGNINAAAWLDYLEVNVRRHLTLTTGQMPFRDIRSVGIGRSAIFIFETLNTGSEIWDVTDISNIKRAVINNRSFTSNTEILREFIAFDNNTFFTPEKVGKIESQNLHALVAPDLVIVTATPFLAEANRLADFHRNADKLVVAVATTEQIFNEFASGKPDMTAIRDLMKMFYDRAANDPAALPQHLLLLGDASYDYKNIIFEETENTNFVPTYQSSQSLRISSTYASDDYFGYLDDNEGTEAKMLGGGQKLDIAIGRMPVKTAEEASGMVDKAIHYYNPATLGDWRMSTVFIGDDEDNNTHVNSANNHADYVMNNCKECNVEKIFLDAYRQENTAGGNRYPDVNKAIDRAIFKGALLINYEGHGGEKGWAHENILDKAQVGQWKNIDRMPLFITATCSFGRYDNPAQTAIGESIVMQPQSGAIAALTTARLVYSGSNATLNQNALNHLFDMVEGKPYTLGEIARLAKNDITSTTSQPNENMHKFNLLGDPALRLALPTQKIVLTELNDQPIANADTINALSLISLKGEVHDQNDVLLADFNGTATVIVYDKFIVINTLQNDPASGSLTFNQRKGLLFRGKASVSGGKFAITFVAPRDLMLYYGKGRISTYAENGSLDAAGYDENVVIGGISNDYEEDSQAPDVKVFINNEDFKFGGTTTKDPVLYLKLFDKNGISTTGSAIGHDLTAVLDGDAEKTYSLNEYYEADINSYQSGTAKFPLYNLSDGRHFVDARAWDTQNNSGKGYTEFVVASSAELALYEVLNYPNPFLEETTFAFEHNRPNELLEVTVQIFSESGQLQKTIRQEVTPTGFRVIDIKWDGSNDLGNPLGRGMYIYRLSLRSTTDNQTVHESNRLVIVK